jgi:Zn-dependent M28 family amino/carboxypeptidase
MIRNFISLCVFLILLTIAAACDSNHYYPQEDILDDPNKSVLKDVEFLSSDSLKGRRTGTEGAKMAREYIIQRFDSLNLKTLNGSYQHPFENPLSGRVANVDSSINVIGMIEGSTKPEQYILLTAHYDHLGSEGDLIYNGADDNASGVAGMMAAAEHFILNAPVHSIIFVAFDAEEAGLAGAQYFTESPPVDLGQIRLVVNLDMISVNTENRLIASGTAHHPFTRPFVEAQAESSPLDIVLGYDTDDWPQNWTFASDHGPFHREGVPFIYFGVEDHEQYHQPGDTFENIDQAFFLETVDFIIGFLEKADENLP